MSVMAGGLEQLVLHHRVEQLLYTEARLLDKRMFDAWLQLYDDPCTYWVPANGEGTDPTREVSVIYDNRARLATRIDRYQSGKAFSQQPPPRTVHVVTNVLVEPSGDGLVVHSSLQVAESRPGYRIDWAGRAVHQLVERDDMLRIAAKKVVLVDNDQELTTLDFLL